LAGGLNHLGFAKDDPVTYSDPLGLFDCNKKTGEGCWGALSVTRLADTPYTIEWVSDLFGIDPHDDNVDIIVRFTTRERYTATFFTLTNLRSLMEGYRESGECASGLYVWSSHMVVVNQLTTETVEQTVADLLASGEFSSAFEGPIGD
jgi:hypothetical protein